MLFKQAQPCTHDVACRAVPAVFDLSLDKISEVVADRDRRILGHRGPPYQKIPICGIDRKGRSFAWGCFSEFSVRLGTLSGAAANDRS
jgi:hypothetical protein